MPSPAFEVLEHTADVGIKAYGSTLAEVFINAARGMIALASGSAEARPVQRLPITVRGQDYESLLVNWLNEILYFLDAEDWIFTAFDMKRLEADALEAEALGERRAGAGTRLRTPVKAVTYHQLAVRETPAGWEATVYFDI